MSSPAALAFGASPPQAVGPFRVHGQLEPIGFCLDLSLFTSSKHLATPSLHEIESNLASCHKANPAWLLCPPLSKSLLCSSCLPLRSILFKGSPMAYEAQNGTGPVPFSHLSLKRSDAP